MAAWSFNHGNRIAIFLNEIAKARLQFRGWPVNCRRIPEAHGRWASFWHLVQEGPIEDDRLPDLRRCERIRWVRWVIENAAKHPEIDEWEEIRGSAVDTLLWYREEYLVVLAKRRDYWLLKTAYCTTQRGRIAKKRRERDAFSAKLKKGAQNDCSRPSEPGRPRMLLLHMAGKTVLVCCRKAELSGKIGICIAGRHFFGLKRRCDASSYHDGGSLESKSSALGRTLRPTCQLTLFILIK